MNILEGLDISHLRMTYLLGMLKAQTHFCNYKGAEIQKKTLWEIKFQDNKIVQYSNILKFDTPF